jgi:hypothetical protein
MSQLDVGCLGGMRRVPKTIDLLTFMIPTFGIYLANPILSLVDTSSVGQFCDATELASLGPGCALCDMVIYLANFLAVATTALLARAIANRDMQKARRHVAGIHAQTPHHITPPPKPSIPNPQTSTPDPRSFALNPKP